MNIFPNKREKHFSLTDFSAILYCYIEHMYLHHSFLSSKLLYLHLHCVSLNLSLGSLEYAEDGNKEDNSLRKMLPAQRPSADSGKPSAFKMEAADLSETSIPIYRTL